VKELLRTNDPVKISYVIHLLSEHNIEAIELDRHTSFIEGSIGAIQRRIMVADDDLLTAQSVLKEID